MASNSSRRQPTTIFAGALANSTTGNIPNSRLLSSTNTLRNALYARNLYNPDNQYPLQNQDDVSRIVDAINSVIAGLTPFKSYNLKNTVYGRLVTNPTPLTEIGLIMLGKQFTLNSMSHIAQQTFPIIKPSNLFDGNKDTKLFSKKINYSITKKKDITNFQKFLDTVVYYYPAKEYPFNKDPSNNDFIENTGTGQLSQLYQAINQNLYKQNSKVLSDYAKLSETEIQPRSFLIGGKDKKLGIGDDDKIFFNINNQSFNPYASEYPNPTSVDASNKAMQDAYYKTSTTDKYGQEYAPTSDFISEYMGRTVSIAVEKNVAELGNASDDSINSWINLDTEFGNDNPANKVVWGRDGATDTTNGQLSQLQGLSEPEVLANYQPQDLKTGFNIQTGLLEYTRNLMNAHEGRIIDTTRKVFTKGDNIAGFNGSGLWRAPSTALPEFANRKGVRQHSALDQYDRFAKAIRFNGNNVYGGNEDSVIYNTVLPRIHPVINKEGNADPRNLMFSIENLAVGVIKGDGVGIIDDEFGSQIPICEVGPFNGRIMWFPPFNLEFNESVEVKYDTIVMVGRNEPMYNYMNSERNATLSFTLLVDYPEQLRGYHGENKQKAIAEFFAFGGEGDGGETKTYVQNIPAKISDMQKQIENIKGKLKAAEPKPITTNTLYVYFPNDIPKVTDNVNTIIDKMYKDYQYEIIESCISSDGGHFGLNNKIYFITGLTSYDLSGATFYRVDKNALAGFSQYTATGITGQFGDCELTKQLKDVFSNVDFRSLYDINIVGSASKLYTELNNLDVVEGAAYNKALGLRRANAVKALVDGRLRALFGKSAAELGITINLYSEGDVAADDNNATVAAIPRQATKQERAASFTIKRNSKVPETKEHEISENDKETITQLEREITLAQAELNRINKTRNTDCVYNERTGADENGVGDAGILGGFKSVSGNYYYPVFHSQTPEDFHKRLTFLHQCTRQGAAKRYSATVDSNGVLRARNSVFGKQPICILRIGDFWYTKVVITNLTVDYADTTWDMNPEGFGMQPMLAKVTLQMKLIGGQSLKGPIDALQNALSFNYYANSSFTKDGLYIRPSTEADKQATYMKGILAEKQKTLQNEYNSKVNNAAASAEKNNSITK